MSEPRLQTKVGLFLLIGLGLIALLVLNFSQGTSIFTSTYEIRMKVASVSGLKEKAAVLLSGVQIGAVKSIGLATDSRTVLVTLRILRRYQVRDDARFVIEQIGLLGDQFIAIYPGEARGAVLPDQAEVQGREPFNLQQVARSASDLITNFNTAAAVVSEAVRRLTAQVLDHDTLSNLSATVSGARLASERATAFVERLDRLVNSNALPLTVGVSNIVSFSERLERVAIHLDETIITNRVGVRGVVTNFQELSASLRKLVDKVDSGVGVAGSLFADTNLQFQLQVTMTNVVLLTSNLTLFGSNLNEHGLLYKPRHPRPNSATIYPGRSPFR